MRSCAIFSLSKRFVGPQNHPYPSKYLLKHVFEFPTLKIGGGGGVSLLPHEHPPGSGVGGWGRRVHHRRTKKHKCLA